MALIVPVAAIILALCKMKDGSGTDTWPFTLIAVSHSHLIYLSLKVMNVFFVQEARSANSYLQVDEICDFRDFVIHKSILL